VDTALSVKEEGTRGKEA
jgi:H/ACA ribonucleoprotein complex non-core subunit NAF1